MTTKIIREKLLKYISSADDKKVKAMYTLLEGDMSIASGVWEAEVEQELVNRSESFKNGTAKTYTWEETKQAAVERHKAKGK